MAAERLRRRLVVSFLSLFGVPVTLGIRAVSLNAASRGRRCPDMVLESSGPSGSVLSVCLCALLVLLRLTMTDAGFVSSQANLPNHRIVWGGGRRPN